MAKFKVNTFDVWGNVEDGYEVNDKYTKGEIEIEDVENEENILQSLKDMGILIKETTLNDIEIEWQDDAFFVKDVTDWYPYCELVKIE